MDRNKHYAGGEGGREVFLVGELHYELRRSIFAVCLLSLLVSCANWTDPGHWALHGTRSA